MREREQVSWENGFAVTLTKQTVFPKRGRSQFGKLRPLGMSTGVDLRGVRERVVDGKMEPSQLYQRGSGRGEMTCGYKPLGQIL